ncbi:cupin [Virgibacillus kimchii]
MKFYKFSKAYGKRVTAFNSDFIMSRIVQTTEVSNISGMHLEKNGMIGYHQAAVPQLLLVV